VFPGKRRQSVQDGKHLEALKSDNEDPEGRGDSPIGVGLLLPKPPIRIVYAYITLVSCSKKGRFVLQKHYVNKRDWLWHYGKFPCIIIPLEAPF